MSAPPADAPPLHHAWIEGDPRRPCLVFLHEGLGSGAMWGGFAHRLCAATGCRGLLYDRAGYGASPPEPLPRGLHYLHRAALVELPRLLDALLPGQPHVLVGHSDGGSIALIHAAERPALLRGVITEAAHVFVEEVSLAGLRAADAAFEAGRLRGLDKYHGARTRTVFKAWSETWTSDWFRRWNLEYLLPAIECPLLVIQGRDDQYATEAQVRAIVEQAGGAARPALIEGCGHTPHKEAPEATLALMREFILGLAPAGAAPDQ